MFDYYETKVFMEAAECQNFTQAAEHLYISQSSLSKTIARLEGRLGFSLFDRTGRVVRLSKEGRIIYEKMKKLLDGLDDAVLTAKRINQKSFGAFSISCSHSEQMPKEMIRGFHRFRECYPQYKYELYNQDFHNFRKQLLDGEVDAVIVRDFAVSTLFNCESLVLCRATPVILVHSSHPAVTPDRRIDMKKLRDYEFVALYSSAYVPYSDNLYRCCEANGFTPELTKFVKQPDDKIENVLLEDFAMVTDELEARFLGERVVYERVENVPKTDVILIWRKDNRNQALLQFVDFMKEQPLIVL